MCLEKASPFTRMILGALLGALLGIASGLLFGLLMAWIIGNLTPTTGMMMENRGPGFYGFTTFFGMGAGAIIGAILGGVYANK